MKVLLANNLLGNESRGGAERVVMLEARGLREAGHETLLVSGLWGSDVPEGPVCVPGGGCGNEVREDIDGLPVLRYRPDVPYPYTELGSHGWTSRFLWHLSDIWNGRSAEMFEAIVRRELPDVVHTHNLMGLGFSIPSRLWRLGIRFVHTVHDVQLLHPSGLVPHCWHPRLPHELAYVALMRWRMGSPDTVIFPSEFLRREHERYGFFRRSRCVVLRNPAPTVVEPRADHEPGRFLFVGQLEPHKGVPELIEAWKSANRRDGSVLRIAGDGSLRHEVDAAAAADPSLVALGRLGWRELRTEYRSAQWLVMPSLVTENAPSVLTEAFSFGLPALASSVGGVPELVREGETGLLFSPGDRQALIDALERAATVSAEEYGRLSSACSQVARGLAVRRHVEGLLDAYSG